ncbi:co-regulatory protein PtrA N-terminal domain-containing protein [Pseudomonas huanghezhanensis]|uniref:co-regulatory protein PtrA N-terminal domain-containing protein n=1 Tax=Pseudomonas huanghezhanensis TaxID=3002903 RepID=UPI0022859FB4|nr:co-regulatory protein PtrA N-terminal domain-containing protein [Pseudomonas sp. BSw22131]
MKAINVVVIALSLAMSSLAFAEGGADRTYERMEKARLAALENRKSASEAQEDVAQEKPTAEKQKHHC